MSVTPPPLNPYRSPASAPVEAVSPGEPALVTRPAAVVVFGVVHLVMAVVGLVSVLITALLHTGYMSLHSAGARASMQAMDEFPRLLLGKQISATLVGVLILVAGMKLLRRKRSALKWSNAYVAASILEKLSLVVADSCYVSPVRRAAYAASRHAAPGFKYSPGYYVLVGMCLSIYAILTLIFLNQPRVKAWFASAA